MGIFETLKKYKWMLPLITKADRKTKATLMKNAMNKKKNFFPAEEGKADVKNLINCMLCPNMCRFDCGSLQAAQKESFSPSNKARVGYYITMGIIDASKEENKEYVDLMYSCTNEENCKLWCPFEFSVVSLLETVRDDLNSKGLMPDYVKPVIDNLNKTNTVEDQDIFKTYKEKGIENIETSGKDEVYYYTGCEMMKFPDVVQGYINILKKAGVKFSTNLGTKTCCGGPAFNIRDLETAKKFALKNKELIEKTGASFIVSDCPGCVMALTKKYQEVGVNLKPKIMHIVEYIANLIEEGKLKLEKEIPAELKTITIHDPCLLARNLGDCTSIRKILNKIKGLEILEPQFNKTDVHCCGWSGTLHWAKRDVAVKEASNRVNELKETGANVMLSACPLCELGLKYGISDSDKDNIKIIDISKLIEKVL